MGLDKIMFGLANIDVISNYKVQWISVIYKENCCG